MIEIALRRSFSGVIAYSAASRQELGGAGQGWQDKSADHGRAHVVGWVGHFGHWQPSGLLALAAEISAISIIRAPSHAFESRLIPMTTRDDELHIQPGRIQHGARGAKRPKSFVGEVMRAAKKAGHSGKGFGRSGRTQGRSTFGRGRRAALSMSSRSRGRRVVVMTPHRSSQRQDVSLGAAVQTYGLSQARGRDARWGERSDVRRGVRRCRREGLRRTLRG